MGKFMNHKKVLKSLPFLRERESALLSGSCKTVRPNEDVSGCKASVIMLGEPVGSLKSILSTIKLMISFL